MAASIWSGRTGAPLDGINAFVFRLWLSSVEIPCWSVYPALVRSLASGFVAVATLDVPSWWNGTGSNKLDVADARASRLRMDCESDGTPAAADRDATLACKLAFTVGRNLSGDSEGTRAAACNAALNNEACAYSEAALIPEATSSVSNPEAADEGDPPSRLRAPRTSESCIDFDPAWKRLTLHFT